jgi:hypothetical protein
MNQLTVLEPRQAPITTEDFNKIEALIEKSFHVGTITEGRQVPQVDTEGDIYGWEFQSVPIGIVLHPRGEVDTRLIDAIQRPATRQQIAYHLTRLSAHKRNAKGATAFQVIIEDACVDLQGRSEWAIVKACDSLRKSEGDFFPSLNDIRKEAEWYDRAAQNIRERKKEPEFIIPKEGPKPPEDRVKGKAFVAMTLHNAGIPHLPDDCSQCKGL